MSRWRRAPRHGSPRSSRGSTPVSRLGFLGAVGLALGALGCQPSEPPVPAGDGPDRSEPLAAAMRETVECVNEVDGYSVEYPSGWHVHTGAPPGPCALFDPDPVEVPRDSEVPLDIAISIDLEPVPFSTLAGEVRGRRDLSRDAATVDGREAVRIMGETTGEGLYDQGIRSYQYVVDLGDSTVIASTYDVGSLPFERKRRILDAMMATFEFLPRRR